MKKFYTIALASAVTLAASAAAPLEIHSNLDFSGKSIKSETELVKAHKALSLDAKFSHKAPAQAPAIPLEGEGVLTLGDYYFEDSTGDFEADATVEVKDGVAIFTSDGLATPIAAAYDEATGVLTFGNLKLGQASVGTAKYYIQAEPFVYDMTTKKIVKQSWTATYSGGKISFDADHGIVWCAYTDENYSTYKGYVDILDIIEFVKTTTEDDSADWTSLGNAVLTDGWLCPTFDIDQTKAENQWEVELQQNKTNDKVYRLVDPYHGKSPVAEYNTSTSKGYIQFDVTDPDHVRFAVVKSGFANTTLGISAFYCTDMLSFYMNEYGVTIAQVLEVDPDCPMTTFKDGVVTLTSNQNDGTWRNSACFGITGEKNGGYVWQDENENPINMFAQIRFPNNAAIDGVMVEDSEAPAAYYNLQGVRVDDNTKGLLIRVQGGKASKVFVR